MTLSYDDTRCSATLAPCKDKERCARFTDPGRPEGWQSFVDVSDMRSDDECAIFIPNEEAIELEGRDK